MMSETIVLPKRYELEKACNMIGISKKTGYRAIDNNELGCYRIGKRIYCGEEHIAAYIRRCERPARVVADAGSLAAA